MILNVTRLSRRFCVCTLFRRNILWIGLSCKLPVICSFFLGKVILWTHWSDRGSQNPSCGCYVRFSYCSLDTDAVCSKVSLRFHVTHWWSWDLILVLWRLDDIYMGAGSLSCDPYVQLKYFIPHHSKVTKGHFSCALYGPKGTSFLLGHIWTCRDGPCLKTRTPSCHVLCMPRIAYTSLFVHKGLVYKRHTFHRLERAS